MNGYPTLSTVLAMDAQALFDHIARHLLAQGGPCRYVDADGDATCLYRDAAGHACAVGSVIPNDLYETRFEGHPLSELVNFLKYDGSPRACLLGQQFERHFSLLAHLQTTHDCKAPCQWPEELHANARHHHLDTTALQQAVKMRRQQPVRIEPAVQRVTALLVAVTQVAEPETSGVCG